MNKFRVFILTIVFAISAVPGFYFGKTASLFIYPFFRQRQLSEVPLSASAEKIVMPGASATPEKYVRRAEMPRSSSTPIVLPDQEKILLIQADNLNSQKPQLISIWGLFISFSDHPNLIFKAIYPSHEEPSSLPELKDQFEIEPGGELSEASLAMLNELGVEWDGYVLTDNIFIDEYGSAYTQTPLSPFLPPTAEPDALLRQETIFLSKTCQFLKNEEIQPDNDFDWKVAASGHLQSDLNLNFLLMGWQWLIEKGSLENCEVLT